MQLYTEQFYIDQRKGSRRSAKEIVPLVLGLIQPKSVIDVGCGVGAWLSVFRECGIDDIYGVDGNWVDKKMLEIPEERFLVLDLTKPVRMNRQFDLVVSLEVAEHLPNEYAEIFVDSLTRLGPTILFSAAIPFQGGTGHINEQWPDYWVKYFQEKGYVLIDCIRKKIWQNDNVDGWYAQNTLMFARGDYLESHPLLKREVENTATSQLSIVHPRIYLGIVRWMHQIYLTAQDIAALVTLGETFILVDQALLEGVVPAGRRAIPFLERDGQYWGAPLDDETAIREFERLRQSGPSFIVFAWPAFWWFEYYPDLHRYLGSKFRCMLQNDRLVAFDLRS